MAKQKQPMENRRTSTRNTPSKYKTHAMQAMEVQSQADLIPAPSGTSFLDLPAEVRNTIYKLALLDGGPTIVLSGPVKPLQPYGDLNTLPAWFRQHFRGIKPSARPNQHRTEWIVSPRATLREGVELRYASGLSANARACPVDAGVRDYDCTYRLTSPHATNLFLVSKQVREEARGVLYTNDRFRFEVQWEDMCMAPLAFLGDQDTICSKIKRLELVHPLPPPFQKTRRFGYSLQTLHPPGVSQWKKLIKALNQLTLEELCLRVEEPTQWRAIEGLDMKRIGNVVFRKVKRS